MAKTPSLGAIQAKLSSLVPESPEFSLTDDEKDVRATNGEAPIQDAPVEATDAPEQAQDGVEAPEAPAEAKPPQTAPEAPITPEPPKTPSAPPTTAQAAEEWADIEYTDEDDGSKYVVRAKKEYADKVKNGYARKSAMSRATGYLGKYKKTLEPLITAGRFDDVAAIIERGETDVEFRNAMYDLFYRRSLGKPIQFADQVPQQTVAPAQSIAPAETSEDDPLGLKALVTSAVAPIQQGLSQLQSANDAQKQWNDYQTQLARSRSAAEMQTANEFQSRFQGEFTGNADNDNPKYAQVIAYAKRAGLFERYGAIKNVMGQNGQWYQQENPELFPLVMITAKLEMDRDNYVNAPSSAAMSAAEAAENAERQSREAAAQIAATQGGGSASSPVTPPKARQKPSLVDEKGKKLNLKQIAKFYEQPVA